MGRHVCRELLLYLTPIRLLQENTNHYPSRKGRKIKDLPSLSRTLSKRRKKEFANKIKIVREQFQKSSRTLSGLFANSFLIVLAESEKTPIILLLLDLETRFLLLSFSLSFPSFLSSLLVLLVHTSYIVTNRNHRTVNERYLYADF